LAISAGASFVARGTVYHATLLSNLIEKALQKTGFSVVEAMSNCHTQYGRQNKEGTATKMILAQKELAVPVSTAAKMTPEQLEGKYITGVLADIERPEYIQQYQMLIDGAQNRIVESEEAPKLAKSRKQEE
jgi:2-oxoglutarate ferredoxin oxidoreductase subunit beta